MKKKYEDLTINHYTLTTGDNQISSPDDIDPKIAFALHGIIKDAQAKGGTKLPGDDPLVLEISIIPGDDPLITNAYIATIFYQDNERLIPLVTSVGAKNEYDADMAWKLITKEMPRTLDFVKGERQISAPMIVDRLICALPRPDLYFLTGSICRHLGWMILYPDAVINQ